MGRHSGDAYEAAPDEWRPVGGGDNGHSPVTRRHVLGILGVAGAAAACTAGVCCVVVGAVIPATPAARPTGLAGLPLGMERVVEPGAGAPSGLLATTETPAVRIPLPLLLFLRMCCTHDIIKSIV